MFSFSWELIFLHVCKVMLYRTLLYQTFYYFNIWVLNSHYETWYKIDIYWCGMNSSKCLIWNLGLICSTRGVSELPADLQWEIIRSFEPEQQTPIASEKGPFPGGKHDRGENSESWNGAGSDQQMWDEPDHWVNFHEPLFVPLARSLHVQSRQPNKGQFFKTLFHRFGRKRTTQGKIRRDLSNLSKYYFSEWFFFEQDLYIESQFKSIHDCI